MQQLKRIKTNAAVVNDYCGYVPQTNDSLEVVPMGKLLGKVNQTKFFENFVLRRKPLKIIEGPVNGVAIDKFSSDSIIDYLGYDGKLQVERKHESGYGLGYERERMSLEELLAKFNSGDVDYYLTTQYKDEEEEEEEGEEDEDGGEDDSENGGVESDADQDSSEEEEQKIENVDFPDSDLDSIDLNNLQDDYVDLDEENDVNSKKISDLLQPPLTNLFKDKNHKSNSNPNFPLIPDILSFLIPQQINLWIGANGKNKNLLQAEGNAIPRYPELMPEKPDFGLGRFVPQNGLSSGLHHDHSDNLYILLQGWKRFTLIAPSEAQLLHTVGEIYRIYKTGIIDYNHPGWSHVADDGSVIEKTTTDEEEMKKPIGKHTPPSFSQIPPIFLHLDEIDDYEMKQKLTAIAQDRFPEILNLPKLEVWLNPGDMLYLPAGWFHEVTSYGFDPKGTSESTSSDIHIALNYWFAPPNGETIDKPYRDDYWKEDFEELLES